MPVVHRSVGGAQAIYLVPTENCAAAHEIGHAIASSTSRAAPTATST